MRRSISQIDKQAGDASSTASRFQPDGINYYESRDQPYFTPDWHLSGLSIPRDLGELDANIFRQPSSPGAISSMVVDNDWPPQLSDNLLYVDLIDHRVEQSVGQKLTGNLAERQSQLFQLLTGAYPSTYSFHKDKESLERSSATRSAQAYSSGSTDYTVKGYVGQDRYQIDALPDTGAKRNFVAQQLVDKLGLVPKAHTKETFRLPSGATIKSSGTVDVPFTFLGESEHHLLDCCILPKCTHDLILCQAFLKATGTLTKFAHRITKSLRRIAPRFRFNLIEDHTCCLQGNFDDTPSVALADTGCDAMLISADFARRHSLEVDKGLEHRHVVEYADGSLDTTTGIVRDSSWQFRSSWDKIPCDFYVLEDLKADIVLSSHFIFQHDVFSQFEEDIIDMSLTPGRDFGDLYNIRLISHYNSALQSLEASSIADMNSPGSFGPAAIKAERVRRDQIRDAINALPPEQQDQARIDERNRQEIWDGYRRRHLERQEGDTDSTQQVLVLRKQRWWQKGLGWQRLGRRATYKTRAFW